MRTLIALSALLTLAACEPEETQVLEGSNLEAACQEVDSKSGVTETTTVAVSASGSSIMVDLIGANANCCPTPEVEVENDAELITVNFIDVTDETEVCDCECDTDFSAEIESVAAGTYSVEVSFLEELVDTVEVVVE